MSLKLVSFSYFYRMCECVSLCGYVHMDVGSLSAQRTQIPQRWSSRWLWAYRCWKWKASSLWEHQVDVEPSVRLPVWFPPAVYPEVCFTYSLVNRLKKIFIKSRLLRHSEQDWLFFNHKFKFVKHLQKKLRYVFLAFSLFWSWELANLEVSCAVTFTKLQISILNGWLKMYLQDSSMTHC